MAASSAAASRPDTCKLVPKGATMSMPGLPHQLVGERIEAFTGFRTDEVGREMRSLDHLIDRAVRQQFAVSDISDLVAALGLVHVMRGDQNGQPVRGERVNFVPKFAPRLWDRRPQSARRAAAIVGSAMYMHQAPAAVSSRPKVRQQFVLRGR